MMAVPIYSRCGVLIVVFVTAMAAQAQIADLSPRLSWREAPDRSITITWDRINICTGFVEYGLTTGLGARAESPVPANRHTVTVRGLEAGRTYWYRVQASDGYVSSLRTFRTAPAANTPFTCVMFGDSRSNTNAHGAVARIIRSYNPLWYGHTGDLVYDGTVWAQWVEFAAVEREVMAYSVFMPTAGNHENTADPASYYPSLFALPVNPAAGNYYSFDVGCMHVVVLDSEMDMNGAQKMWLENDMQKSAANSAIAWTIIYFHRPPYSSGAHGSQLDVRAAWCSIFEKYGVAMVFAGNDHHYERSRLINGVMYVVTGGGGAPLYSASNSWFTAAVTSCYHAVVLDVEPARIRYRAVRHDGVVFDDMVINNTRIAGTGMAARIVRPADFDGDDRNDLAVYDPVRGRWFAQGWGAAGESIAWATPWGFAGAVPVPADYDGDGRTDLAVYYPFTGGWYIYSLAKAKVIAWDFRWGFAGAVPVPGDYDGDSAAEPAIYVPGSGDWYVIRLADSRVVAWKRAWGAGAMMPVPGDYNGDGHDDLGVYNPADGRWYIQSVDDSSHAMAWARAWGYSGARPVPGDYNGDGACDLAVYDAARHTWFAVTLNGTAVAWNIPWGFDGAITAPADYNGDGKTDAGIHDPGTGAWYIYSLAVPAGVLSWNRRWGFQGAVVIGGTY